ncbi:hypothetical protein [Pseudonocardia sp.]|uniref:hypothetical protein n=1 Tax=Pseudonocardia sp. TaxID=60912 RepID=UPI003D0ED0D7
MRLRPDTTRTRPAPTLHPRSASAWLTNKESTARAAGGDAPADLVTARLSKRQDRLDRLAAAKRTVEDIRTNDCS